MVLIEFYNRLNGYLKKEEKVSIDVLLAVGLVGLFISTLIGVFLTFPITYDSNVTTQYSIAIIGASSIYLILTVLFFGLLSPVKNLKNRVLLAGIAASPILIALIFFSILDDLLLEVWMLLVLVLAITEIFFWIDKNKPEKDQNVYWFTAKRKITALIDSIITIGFVIGSVNLGKKALKFIESNQGFVTEYGFYFATIIIAVGTLGLLIFINSLKYKKQKEKKPNQPGKKTVPRSKRSHKKTSRLSKQKLKQKKNRRK